MVPQNVIDAMASDVAAKRSELEHRSLIATVSRRHARDAERTARVAERDARRAATKHTRAVVRLRKALAEGVTPKTSAR